MINKIIQWLTHIYTNLRPVLKINWIVGTKQMNNLNNSATIITDLGQERSNGKHAQNIKTMMMITEPQLKQIYPFSTSINRAKYLPYLNKYMPEYEITSLIRIWSYMAQIGHESGQLNYSEEIASGKAYEGRKDLGNTEPGDGIRFKGRGLIQLTGRSNYQSLSNAFGIDFVREPELLKTPELAVKSSLWFWKSKNLNAIADSGDFKLLTKRINGGYTHLADRIEIFERCKRFIGMV
jgi:putative chitinase